MAPQHPRKPTTIISAPAPIRIYTPAHTHTHTQYVTDRKIHVNITMYPLQIFLILHIRAQNIYETGPTLLQSFPHH